MSLLALFCCLSFVLYCLRKQIWYSGIIVRLGLELDWFLLRVVLSRSKDQVVPSLIFYLVSSVGLKLQMAECEGDGTVSRCHGEVICLGSWYGVHGLLWGSFGALLVVFLCDLLTLLNPFLSPCKRMGRKLKMFLYSMAKWWRKDILSFMLSHWSFL